MITTAMLEGYGMLMRPEDDMKTKEALLIIKGSKTKMEIAGSSYIYGYMRGSGGGKKMVPMIKLKQISDEEWDELTKKQQSAGKK